MAAQLSSQQEGEEPQATAQAVGDREAMKGLDPLAWRLFQRFSLELIERGFAHYSSDAVLHRVRWETAVTIDDGSCFKVNNNVTPLYARHFHEQHPAHAGFFRTRVSKYDVM
jgi:hypothetical protein